MYRLAPLHRTDGPPVQDFRRFGSNGAATGRRAIRRQAIVGWQFGRHAAVAIETRNHTANAYITGPTIGGDLDILTSGDGTNSAKLWLGAPPSLANVPRFTTGNCPTANLFVGDWSQFVFAVRQDAMLEVTTTGGDSFSKHQLLVKATFRGDVGCLDETAFQCLTGLTS